MKTKEELNALKEELLRLNEKLKELSEEELEIVTGGLNIDHYDNGTGKVTMHNMPQKNSDEQYFMKVDVGLVGMPSNKQ